jgi:hypothetical protein
MCRLWSVLFGDSAEKKVMIVLLLMLKKKKKAGYSAADCAAETPRSRTPPPSSLGACVEGEAGLGSQRLEGRSPTAPEEHASRDRRGGGGHDEFHRYLHRYLHHLHRQQNPTMATTTTTTTKKKVGL